MHAFKHIVRPLILVLTLGSASAASAQTVLHDGQPIASISGATDSQKHFMLWVPKDTKQVQIQMIAAPGSIGDADMFIRRGSQATTVSWSYRPYIIGNNESVTLNNPTSSGGEWYYVMIDGYHAYNGVTLRADFQAGPRLYDNGGVIKNMASQEDQERHFKMLVPLNASKLIVKLAGGSGDADLYVRKYGPATDTYWDYRSINAGPNESVIVTNPSSGLWYIFVAADTNYSGVKITVEYEGLPKYRMSNVGLNDKGTGVCFTKSPLSSWRYGYWGGPGWTNGREERASAWAGVVTAQPIDAMDALFQVHDQSLKAAGNNDSARDQADQALLDGLADLPNQTGGLDHPVWGEIWDSPTFWSMPNSVTVKPGSPIALPQVISSPTPMPFSEYVRRQAMLGVTAGWFGN